MNPFPHGEAGKNTFTSRIPHAVIGQWDWRSSIDDFEVRYFQCSQRVGIEIEVGVLCFCVQIVLCGEGDVARVCQEHTILLHGPRDDLCRGVQLCQII